MTKIDGRTLDHATNEYVRLLAVRRVREGGEKPSVVMKSLGLCRTTIYRWLRRYDKKGLRSLKSTQSKGPKPKLSPKQCKEVRRWIVGNDPRQYGFDFGLWTQRIVAEMIQEKFGISLSLSAISCLLEKLKITPQKPLRRAYERNPKAVKQWTKKTYPKLRKRAKKTGATIYFLDEAGFSSEPNLGRTYGAKGKTPIVKTTGQRQRINAISAVSAKGEFWCEVYSGNFNATRFLDFLDDFREGRGKVFLVVDGHPSHRAKMVQAYVQNTKGMLELHFLPPYAPDLNPDEFVWQYAKTNGVCKKPLKQGESLKSRVEADLAFIKSRPKLVRSFFMAESVAYTAA